MRTYSDDELIDSINRAPSIVQSRISDPNTAIMVASIGKKRNLHIDQIGKMAELNRNVLLGLASPEDFVSELVRIGVAEKDAKDMLSELNQKIFTPLHNEMKLAVIAPQVPMQATYAPPPQSPKYFHLENKIPAAFQPRRPAAHTAQPAPLPPFEKPASPASSVQTTQPDRMLEDHEVPHIELNKTPDAPAAETPLAQAVRTALSSSPAPRPNLSGTVPPPASPKATQGTAPPNLPGAMPPPPPPATPKPAQGVTPPNSGLDPYREPLD